MTDALVNLALRNASLCGALDPFKLFEWIGLSAVEAADRDAALRDLACRFSEQIRGDYLWVLEPDSRREALEGLASHEMIQLALSSAPGLRPDDAFGAALRAALSDAEVEPPPRGPDEAGEAHLGRQLRFWADVFDAAQFAEAAPGCDGDAVRRLQNRASQRIRALRSESDIQIVLPKVRERLKDGSYVDRPIPLIGRSHYKRRLSRHLRGLDEDGRPVLLTGVGGAGKSALLASVIRPWRDRETAPVTIILDFDRRQLVTGEPAQMMHEFLRQLATGLAVKKALPPDQLKDVLEFLGSLRELLPSRFWAGEPRSFDSQYSFMLSAVFPRFDEAAAAPLRDIPVALLMDSFEAVHRQYGAEPGSGDDPENEVGRRDAPVIWMLLKIEEMLRESGLRRLRTVVSGRADPFPERRKGATRAAPGATQEFFGDRSRRVHLAGVGKVSGGRLLQALDTANVFTDREQCEAASEALGGHPLTLQILARYAASHEVDAEALLKELTENDRFKAEFAQTFLYDRILGRIADDKVRDLAHPGLVLRQLNADMIRLVLAEPCFGETISADEAETLLKRLENEYWMVEPGDRDFPVRHRPDLRRLMTPGLFAAPRATDREEDKQKKRELRRKARAVCRAAAELFETGPPEGDPAELWWADIPPADREVEALYYRALGTDAAPEFGQEVANRMRTALGEDLKALPVAWVARVKAWTDEPLREAELETLPPDLQERAASAAFERSIRQGGGVKSFMEQAPAPADMDHADAFAPAPADVEPVDALAPPPAPKRRKAETAEQMEREIHARFTTADFDGVAEMGPDYLRRAQESRSHSHAGGDDLWFWPGWQCALVAGADPGDHWRIESHPAEKHMRPIDGLILLIQAILDRDEGEIRASSKALIGGTGDWVSPEQMPISANRQVGDDVLGALLGERLAGMPQRKDPRADMTFTLSPRAFALGAQRPAPDGGTLPEAPPVLPGALSFIIDPIYGGKTPTLGDLQKIYRAGELVRFDTKDLHRLEPQARDMFAAMVRGLSPELYEAATAVLRDQPDITVVASTAELNQSHAAKWPRDLRFEKVKFYDPAQAATIVETADICGVLGDLLNLIAEHDPRAARLARMHACIGEWFFPKPAERRRGATISAMI